MKLNIKTVKRLASILRVPDGELAAVSRMAGRHYESFYHFPRVPPFSRRTRFIKRRPIDKPLEPLKSIQKKIQARLLRQVAWPDHIFGGIKHRSSLDISERHIGSDILVSLDIRSFFPSVTTFQVYRVWNELLGCSPEVAAVLTRLTTFERRLPQGAPTSTSLANLVLYQYDELIRETCHLNGIEYSTWIDDLIFSGPPEATRDVINLAISSMRHAGFAISHRKLKVMPAHKRQQMLGLITNRKATVPKAYLSATRSGIYKLREGYVTPKDMVQYVRSLRGRIEYIRRTNSSIASQLGVALTEALVIQVKS